MYIKTATLSSYSRLALVAFTITGLLALGGCVGATRLPARSQGPTGARVDQKQIDLGFIQAGVTTRDEVVQKLAMIDSGYSDPRFFWGRWADSKWGYWWVIAAGNTAAGDARRVWHVKNLLVTFDERGVAQKVQFIAGDKLLWRQMHDYASQAVPLDLAEKVPLHATGFTQIALTRDGMQIERARKADVVIPPSAVARITHDRFLNVGSQRLGTTCQSLRFSQKTPVGKRLYFCTDGPGAVALVRYLQQAGPATMQWE